MTQDEIIELANEAGIIQPQMVIKTLEAFAKLVADKELEAAEERVVDLFENMEYPYLPDITKAIRGDKA